MQSLYERDRREMSPERSNSRERWKMREWWETQCWESHRQKGKKRSRGEKSDQRMDNRERTNGTPRAASMATSRERDIGLGGLLCPSSSREVLFSSFSFFSFFLYNNSGSFTRFISGLWPDPPDNIQALWSARRCRARTSPRYWAQGRASLRLAPQVRASLRLFNITDHHCQLGHSYLSILKLIVLSLGCFILKSVILVSKGNIIVCLILLKSIRGLTSHLV